METILTNSPENSSQKRKKIHLSRLEVSHKMIAFQEILALKENRSAREVASFLKVSNSTMQSWRSRECSREVLPELVEFFSTFAGIEFLQRLIMSAYQVIHFGCGGIRALQEFLRLSGLNHFIASSDGALQAFSVRCEKYIVAFGDAEEKKLAEKMKRRKITAALDEMFRGAHPCLVAIEIVSGFILLEKFTEDRTATTWTKELTPRIEGLNIELEQVVSDLCGGIRACAKELKAEHSPDLFHAQQELTKATSAPLAAQEREFDNNVKESEQVLAKIINKHGEESEQAQIAAGNLRLRRIGLKWRKERRQKVRDAKKEIGRIHHPINLKTGKVQNSEEVSKRFDEQLRIIEECSRAAGLKTSSEKRLTKAKRAFEAITRYVTYFFTMFAASKTEMNLTQDEEQFFNEIVFPLSYLNVMWRRLPKKDKEELLSQKETLERKFRESIYYDRLKDEWLKKGQKCAEMFQRSSSCVEGRNGMLSLYYHRFHRLNTRGLRALTVVHNFHIRRLDGTTAAERLFSSKHDDLFESMVAHVRIPGLPHRKKLQQTEKLAA